MTNSGAGIRIIREWLGLPQRNANLLLVAGSVRAGKSEFIRDAAAVIDRSILVECAGLSAEAVAQQIVTAVGADLTPSGQRWRRDLLRTSVEGEHVVLLSNAQWAGKLVGSSEPTRLADSLVSKLTWAPKARIRIVLEWDSALLGEPPRSGVSTSLPAPDVPDTDLGLPGQDSATVRAVEALSLSELPSVDLSVWRLLVTATGPSQQQPPVEDLEGIAGGKALLGYRASAFGMLQRGRTGIGHTVLTRSNRRGSWNRWSSTSTSIIPADHGLKRERWAGTP